MKVISRRRFFKLGAAASAYGLVRSRALGQEERAPKRSSKNVDVVIVGAGLAGLNAARILVRQGVSVAVLEARDRIGGRVSTGASNGLNLDLGAQFVGPGQTRLYDLIREAGVGLAQPHEVGETLYALGEDLRRGRGDANPPLGPLALLDLNQRLSKFEGLTSSNPEAWKRRAAAWDSQTLAIWLEKTCWTRDANRFVTASLESDLCATTGEVSLLSALTRVKSMGGLEKLMSADREFCVGGAAQLSRWLARNLGDALFLNSPVQRIEHGRNSVQVWSGDDTWRARALVVALPPALGSRIDYSPKLPSLRDQLTQRLGQGSVIKCMCVYERPFWRERGLSGASVSDQGPVTATIDSTLPGGPGVLVALVTGPHARRLSAMQEGEKRQSVLNALTRMFGSQATQLTDYIEHDWDADEWSRGGYGAVVPPGVLTQFGSALSEPCGRIFWAGTETADVWSGYMEGALQSGERAAAEVSSLFSSSQIPPEAVVGDYLSAHHSS